MKLQASLLLLILIVGLCFIPQSGAVSVPLALMTSTAVRSFNLVESVTQAGSTWLAPTPTNISFGVTGATLVTLTISAQIGHSASSTAPAFAQVNFSQGSFVPYNGTMISQVTFHPHASYVLATTVALYTYTGARPDSGAYKVFFNGTQTVQFSQTNPVVWNFNGTSYSVVYPLIPPAGYTLNATSLFLPFPGGVPVNFTTIKASLGSTNLNALQVSSGGINAFIPTTLGASVIASFIPLPVVSGVVPYIQFSSTTRAFNGTLTSTSSWFNGRTMAYAGLYILATHFTSPINPYSLKIWFNHHLLSNGTYVMSGGTIVVQQYAYATAASTNLSISLGFTFLNTPPTLSIGRSFPVTVSSFTAPLGSLILLAMLATAFSTAVVIWVGAANAYRGPWKHRTKVAWTLLYVFIVEVAVLLVIPP